MHAKDSVVIRVWLGRRFRQAVRWVLGFHGRPTEVARGIAIGVFVAFTPSLGLQMATAAVLATMTYSNRPAAMGSVWVSNPFTALPIYMLTYRVGRFLVGTGPVDIRHRLLTVVVDDEGSWFNLTHQVRELVSLGSDVLIPLTVGGAILGLLAAMVTYVLTHSIITWAKRRFHLGR
ncbi:MAG: DUF2062 domain-containing protein [Planctomycetota bacterium]